MRAPPRRADSRRAEYSGRRPTDVVLEELVEPGLETAVFARLAIGFLELGQRRHQGLWNEPAAKGAEIATVVREFLHEGDDST